MQSEMSKISLPPKKIKEKEKEKAAGLFYVNGAEKDFFEQLNMQTKQKLFLLPRCLRLCLRSHPHIDYKRGCWSPPTTQDSTQDFLKEPGVKLGKKRKSLLQALQKAERQ